MVKVAVVGLGYWGPKLARNFNDLAGVQLQWGCDLNEQRLDHVRQLCPGIRVTRDYAEVLASDVDAVCIATPVRTHFPLAVEALRAGKHVLIEKPLAASVVEAEGLVAESEQQKRLVMVGHTFMYNPAVIAMKEIIAAGELGNIYYIDGTRVNLGLFQPDINVVWDLAPHDISMLSYVLDMSPVCASARGGAYVQREAGIHDVAYLNLDFPNGLLANIRISWLDPCKIRRYTVVGSEKMLVYDDCAATDKIMIYDKGVDQPPHSDTEQEFHLSYRTGEGVPYPLVWMEPLRLECQHFVDCIQDGSEPRSSGKEGLRVVRVLEAAQRSLMNGGARERVC
jgi:predicted dehydrogenase